MSRDTNINFGTYLICTMSSTTVDVEVVRCSNNAAHPVNEDDKFCSKCGAKTGRTVHVERAFQSLHSIANGDVVLPEADAQWLFDRFTPLYEPDSSVPHEERIMYDPGSMYVTGDADSVTDFDPATSFPVPSPEEIEKLAEIMGYIKIGVRHGVIVSISY